MRAQSAIPRVRAFRDEPPSPHIMLEDLFERLGAPIMKIRRRERDVAERRRSKSSHILRLPRHIEDAPITERITALSVDIIEAVIMKRQLDEGEPLMVDRVAEEHARVAMKAFGPLAEKELHAVKLFGCERGLILLVNIAIVARAEGDNGSLKGGERDGDGA